MTKNILIAGLLGGIAMTVWLVVSNAMLPFKSELMHKRLPLEDQLALHGALAAHVTETGLYSVPYLPHGDEDRFPDYRDQPVYAVHYDGTTHGAGSPLSAMPFAAIFASALLAAWMLASAGDGVRSGYLRRVLFIAAIGVIMALADDVLQMSFGPQPRDYLTFLAVNNVVTWLIAGLVIGGRIGERRPGTDAVRSG